jgi:hypothetical protein
MRTDETDSFAQQRAPGVSLKQIQFARNAPGRRHEQKCHGQMIFTGRIGQNCVDQSCVNQRAVTGASAVDHILERAGCRVRYFAELTTMRPQQLRSAESYWPPPRCGAVVENESHMPLEEAKAAIHCPVEMLLDSLECYLSHQSYRRLYRSTQAVS